MLDIWRVLFGLEYLWWLLNGKAGTICADEIMWQRADDVCTSIHASFLGKQTLKSERKEAIPNTKLDESGRGITVDGCFLGPCTLLQSLIGNLCLVSPKRECSWFCVSIKHRKHSIGFVHSVHCTAFLRPLNLSWAVYSRFIASGEVRVSKVTVFSTTYVYVFFDKSIMPGLLDG